MNEPVRILVAEDEADDAFLLERAFARAGIKATIQLARDGQEAVDYLRGSKPSTDRQAQPLPVLVLLDLKMPRLDGFDVLEWLRQQPGLRRLSVVVFSSSNEPRDINRAYDLGANSYAVKPVDPASLVEFEIGRAHV